VQDGRPADAAEIIGRLPPAARDAEMQALLARARVATDIGNAEALAAISPAAARQRLLALAAAPDPDGTRGVAVAHAFIALHDAAGAREALATAQAATPNPSPAQRLAYAGTLLDAGDMDGARVLIASLQVAPGLTPDQRRALAQLSAGIAVRTADTLNNDGRTADAYDVLAPELARNQRRHCRAHRRHAEQRWPHRRCL
jgi:hypothetical protein